MGFGLRLIKTSYWRLHPDIYDRVGFVLFSYIFGTKLKG